MAACAITGRSLRLEGRRTLQKLLTCWLVSTAGWASAELPQRPPLYVINAKEPSITIVDSATWKVAGSIPVSKQPTDALLAPDNQFLYVLHDGMSGPVREINPGAGRGSHPVTGVTDSPGRIAGIVALIEEWCL